MRKVKKQAIMLVYGLKDMLCLLWVRDKTPCDETPLWHNSLYDVNLHDKTPLNITLTQWIASFYELWYLTMHGLLSLVKLR